MAEIFVQSSAALDSVIEDLRAMRSECEGKENDLAAELSNVAAKWTGDASDAFINNWNTDSANFQNFLTVIDQYIQGLEQIKADYEQAEGMNTTIGEQRTH